MHDRWIMTGKTGNHPRLVLTVTCIVVAISRTIAGHIGSAYTVDHGGNIIVTANAPLLLAGLEITAGKNAGSPVCLGTDSRIINTVKGAARTVTGIADRGICKNLAVQELATGSKTAKVTGSAAGYLRTKGIRQVGLM